MHIRSIKHFFAKTKSHFTLFFCDAARATSFKIWPFLFIVLVAAISMTIGYGVLSHIPPRSWRSPLLWQSPWFEAVEPAQRFVNGARIHMSQALHEYVYSGGDISVFDGADLGRANLLRKAMNQSAGANSRDNNDEFFDFVTARNRQLPFEFEEVEGRGRLNWNALRKSLLDQEATHFAAEWRRHLLVGALLLLASFFDR